MEITLIKHGKFLWTENKPITCLQFKVWVQQYDRHGVFEEKSYPSETVQKIHTANIVRFKKSV